MVGSGLHIDSRQRLLLPDDCISKEWLSGPGERHSWVIGDPEMYQRGHGKICKSKFFLVTALRKGAEGPIVRWWPEHQI